ncbi:DEAD/DEAH box helicase [Photobacterium nomapromontoriensis]|uniref:DEAD/DEAH box helicase n=1 Tax=Photobacterium nomapromontoriensis TaxID=2910237 RepID=UPI003D098424
MLRPWQSECVNAALALYRSGQTHYFCQATPGAGKTVMAAELAKHLIEQDEIDLVLCFSPSLTIAQGIQSTFSWMLGCAFNGGLGSLGASYTYQTIRFLDDNFWNTVKKHRLFVVFDEIHHCSADDEGRSNVWGEQVISKLQSIAKYTLALSGTPWRSDSVPIAMATYTDPEGQVRCDFSYGLKQAIDDKVCRLPKIVLIDNEHLSVSEGEEMKSFSSILELIKQSHVSYQSVIHNDNAMNYLLGLSCDKLEQIRMESPKAGGLVVAASVQHAKTIQSLLINQFGQSACIVTYRHEAPLEEIESFRQSDTQWIVSVGMISEGTDIPRLQVCCHMSAVKTELYFRQVLGRILRVNDSPNQEAWLFTFAEESLVGFAERIEQDIPETCMFINRKKDEVYDSFQPNTAPSGAHIEALKPAKMGIAWDDIGTSRIESLSGYSVAVDELRLGRFRQRVIAAFS